MKYLSTHRVQLGLAGIVATAFVFGPALAWSLGITPKAIENRALSPAPAASDGWDALDTLSPWATDHLPGRDKAVHMNAWVDYNVLGQLPAAQKEGAQGTSGAPTVVRGKDGYLFLGEDFTVACEKTVNYERSLESLAALAEIIQRSGRKVVFSVAPNKTSVTTGQLPGAMPRGSCAERGIRGQNQMLDTLKRPLYVGVRKPLADAHSSGQQVFLRTDTHWTLLGGAIYARAVAAQLDPELARKLRLKPERMTKVGELMRLIGLTSTESVMSQTISSSGTVFPGPKAAPGDPRRAAYRPDTWSTVPAKGLIQGRTLLLGDSFTAVAGLTSLRPVFAQGRFVLFGFVPESQLISEIRSAETVVIEVVQRGLVGHVVTRPGFQKQVASALGVPAR